MSLSRIFLYSHWDNRKMSLFFLAYNSPHAIFLSHFQLSLSPLDPFAIFICSNSTIKYSMVWGDSDVENKFTEKRTGVRWKKFFVSTFFSSSLVHLPFPLFYIFLLFFFLIVKQAGNFFVVGWWKWKGDME